MAKPTCLHLNEDLPRLELTPGHLLDRQGRVELVDDSSVVAGDAFGRRGEVRNGHSHEVSP
jgi:hypothetical protein